jgi:hypothetical protein
MRSEYSELTHLVSLAYIILSLPGSVLFQSLALEEKYVEWTNDATVARSFIGDFLQLRSGGGPVLHGF